MGLLTLLLVAAVHGTTAAAYWSYESLNVTQWQWQSSVVVDNWLYIDGGELYALRNGVPTFFYLGQTVSIDLSQPWTNSTVQNYTKATQRPVTDGHWSKKPALFYDASSHQVVQWGGWPYDNGDQPLEFVFTPNGSGIPSWSASQPPVTDNAVNETSPAVFGAAFVAANTSFFSLGGVAADPAAPPDVAVAGLVEYSSVTDVWANTSSSGATSNGFLVGAQASYTPGSDVGGFGDAGYLVFVGGSNPPTQLSDPQAPSLVDMSNITLYDIAAKAWYHQTATGTIPSPRQFFCSVAATSIQATFEIFILGGSTNDTWDQAHANDTDYLDVFALSIPAFRWFKANDSDLVRRADHACQVIGNKQMLVIGGTQPSNPAGIAAVDPWPNGLGIFDMSAFAWADRYDPAAAPYQQPAMVRDYYTNDYQAPVWDSPALEPVFAWAPPDLPTGTYTGSYPSATATSSVAPANTTVASPSPSPDTSRNHTDTGAIVGGVVGGVCGLLAVVALVLFVRRRRMGARKKKDSPPPDDGSLVIAKHELESPLSSPGIQVPLSGVLEKDGLVGGGGVPEMESREPVRAELEAPMIRRKPVPELP